MAMVGADRLAGLDLRYAISLCLLDAQSPLRLPDVIARVEAFGFVIPGRPSKTVSDAMRWEVRKGRVVRLGRSLYKTGRMPRSTEWWIRSRVAAERELSLTCRRNI